jgi:tetratricopeptide (TPR) repeat protein
LLSYNTEKSNYAATSIDLNMLQRYVDAFINKGASVVLITDACRSGNLAGGLAGTTSTLNSLKQGFNNCTKILSCQPNQLSLEKRYADGGHGVFTYHLVNALNRLADRNNDRTVNLRELDIYLDSVSAETDQRQIPRVEGNPLFSVSNYKDSIRNAIAAKGVQSFRDNIAKRSVANGAFDSNPIYITFQEQIKKGQLIDPSQNNAYQTIEQAIKSKESEELIQQMKIELSAVLEDEVQGFANRILRGEFIRRASRQPLAKKYLDLMTACLTLQDTTELRYNELAAMKTWLESRYQYYSNIFSANTSLIKQLKNADEKINNHALIYNELGNLYFEINKLDSSSYYYKKAIEYSPTWMYPIGNLGYNYEKQGNDSLALFYYKMANQMEPSHPIPIAYLGEFYFKKRDYAKAKTYLNQALAIDSTDFHTLQVLGSIAIQQKEYLVSMDYYKRAISLDSTQVESWYGLAFANYNLKNLRDAERIFLQALKINPKLGTSHYNLACIYSITNQLEESLTYLENAIKFGYKEFKHFESDPDLENLRKTAAYEKLIRKYK